MSLVSFFLKKKNYICAGGIVALYSQLCRNAKFCLLPNLQASDEELSTYHKNGCSNRNIPPSPLKRFIEKHKSTKIALLILVLLGACMAICVGAIMPAISGKATFFLRHVLVYLIEPNMIYVLPCTFGYLLFAPSVSLLIRILSCSAFIG